MSARELKGSVGGAIRAIHHRPDQEYWNVSYLIEFVRIATIARCQLPVLIILEEEDGLDVPPPSRQHGSWRFYFEASK
jgi:hypothetical protein